MYRAGTVCHRSDAQQLAQKLPNGSFAMQDLFTHNDVFSRSDAPAPLRKQLGGRRNQARGADSDENAVNRSTRKSKQVLQPQQSAPLSLTGKPSSKKASSRNAFADITNNTTRSTKKKGGKRASKLKGLSLSTAMNAAVQPTKGRTKKSKKSTKTSTRRATKSKQRVFEVPDYVEEFHGSTTNVEELFAFDGGLDRALDNDDEVPLEPFSPIGWQNDKVPYDMDETLLMDEAVTADLDAAVRDTDIAALLDA